MDNCKYWNENYVDDGLGYIDDMSYCRLKALNGNDNDYVCDKDCKYYEVDK